MITQNKKYIDRVFGIHITSNILFISCSLATNVQLVTSEVLFTLHNIRIARTFRTIALELGSSLRVEGNGSYIIIDSTLASAPTTKNGGYLSLIFPIL